MDALLPRAASGPQEAVYLLTAMMDHRKIKVLVVDDEHAIADTLKAILDNAGYEARATYSGEMAVGQLCDFQPDLLVIDVIMSGMTGIQVAINVCATLPSCKVILISGNAETAALLDEELHHDREFEILAKPFHPTDLIAKMRTVMSA